MKILVLNCGSSSVKFQLIDMERQCSIASGLVEQIGEASSHARINHAIEQKEVARVIANHHDALELVYELLKETGADQIDAIGHRVVHGGERFQEPTIIDDEVLDEIEKLSTLAPLHNPANAEGIRVAISLHPELKQVAVFDTAFHQTLPKHAYLYALPYELYQGDHVRRYGFHGTSHLYVAKAAAAYLGKTLDALNLITLHLGNGASATAIKAGKSIDTSMGMTPLEGLVMGTRSGDMDPAILLHLMRTKKMDAFSLDRLVNKESGLKGICGENDLRRIIESSDEGDERAFMAIEVMTYRIKKYIGAYAAALGHVDAIVFTGGIGEHAAIVRKKACEGLTLLGIEIDQEKNEGYDGGEASVASEKSQVDVLVIPTNEELEIARQTLQIVRGRK